MRMMKSCWQLGVFFGFCTSIVGCLSKLAIRKSWTMSTETAKAEHAARTIRYIAILGISCFNPIFDILAINYASPSLLAPFSGLTLAWIVLLSKQLIGENPKRKQVIAAGTILVGEFFVMAFGDHTSDEQTTQQDVISAYQDPILQGYFVAEIVYLGSLFYLIQLSPGSGGHYAGGRLKRFAWGMAGGSVTSLQCFLKDALTILKASEDDDDMLRRPWKLPLSFFFLLLLAIITAVAGLLILTACMKRYDATFSNAMNAGAFVVSASIMSAVRYNTFDNLDSDLSRVLYPFGLIVILFGLFILVRDTDDTTTDAAVGFQPVPQIEIIEASNTPTAASMMSGTAAARERSCSVDHYSKKLISLELGALNSPTPRKRTFSTGHRISLTLPLEVSELQDLTFSPSDLFGRTAREHTTTST